MSIPYFGSHPTGIVFNIDEYRLIWKRQKLFTREAAYIHPHDLILGQLAEYGEMFQFKKIWSLVGTESFASNKSFLYKKGTIEDAWFSPKARTEEFRLFIEQIAKRYLFYCTLNYAFFISDAGQTAHYGIEPKKLSRRELAGIMHGFVNESHKILQQNVLDNNEAMFKNMMTSYFWAIYFGKPVWDKVKKLK